MTQQPASPSDQPDLRPVDLPVAGAEMTLIEHLLELRTRVFVCAAAVVLGVIGAWFIHGQIFDFLLEPARANLAEGDSFRLTSFSPTDRIFVIFKIVGYTGLILASPVIIMEVLLFVLPGLTSREKRGILPAMFGFVFFLLAGMAFSYYIILPASLNFLLNFENDSFENKIGATQYIGFVTRLIFWVGVCFEMPMVMMLLAKVRVARAGQMLRFWRYAIVIIALIAAIATPTPDALTMSLVVAPLLGLYVLGIAMAWLVQPKKPREAAA